MTKVKANGALPAAAGIGKLLYLDPSTMESKEIADDLPIQVEALQTANYELSDALLGKVVGAREALYEPGTLVNDLLGDLATPASFAQTVYGAQAAATRFTTAAGASPDKMLIRLKATAPGLTGTLVVKLHSDAGTHDQPAAGAALATSDGIDLSTVPVVEGAVLVTFAVPAALAAATDYWVSVSLSDAGNTDQYRCVNVSCDGTDGAAPSATSTDGGATWTPGTGLRTMMKLFVGVKADEDFVKVGPSGKLDGSLLPSLLALPDVRAAQAAAGDILVHDGAKWVTAPAIQSAFAPIYDSENHLFVDPNDGSARRPKSTDQIIGLEGLVADRIAYRIGNKTGVAQAISAVKMKFAFMNAATAHVAINVYSDNAGVPDTLIAAGDIQPVSGTTPEEVTFTFGTPFSLPTSGANKYVWLEIAVVDPAAAFAGGNFLYIYGDLGADGLVTGVVDDTGVAAIPYQALTDWTAPTPFVGQPYLKVYSNAQDPAGLAGALVRTGADGLVTSELLADRITERVAQTLVPDDRLDHSEGTFDSGAAAFYLDSLGDVFPSFGFTYAAETTIGKATFKLKRVGSVAAATFVARIYDSTLTNILYTSDSVPDSGAWSTADFTDVDFVFSTPPVLPAGTYYMAIAVATSNGGGLGLTTTNKVQVGGISELSNKAYVDVYKQILLPTGGNYGGLIRSDASGFLDDSFLQKDIDLGGHVLSGVSTPVASTDAANKSYVDTRVLDNLADVTIASVADKQALVYDNGASQWKNVSTYDARSETSSQVAVYGNLASPADGGAFDVIGSGESQKFRPSASVSVSQAIAVLTTTGGVTGNVKAEIYDATGAGGAPGNLLATSDLVDASTFATGSNLNVTFIFSTPPALTSGTDYHLVIRSQGLVGDLKWVGTNTDEPNADGWNDSLNDGSSWVATGTDFLAEIDYTSVTIDNAGLMVRADSNGYLDDSFLQKDIDFGGHVLSGVAAPAAGTDAVNKTYADAGDAATLASAEAYTDTAVNHLSLGIFPRASVDAVATSNFDLSSTTQPTFDGRLIADGKAFLLAGQTDAKENGVYVATDTAGTWSFARRADMDGSPAWEIRTGITVFVENGDTHFNERWTLTGTASGADGYTIALGTDDLVWSEYSKVSDLVPQDALYIDATGGQELLKLRTGFGVAMVDESGDMTLEAQLDETVYGAGSSGLTKTANGLSFAHALYDNLNGNSKEIQNASKVGIAVAGSPAQLLDIASKFQVDANGNLVKINNVGYSFPAAQATLAGQALVNDGSGNLTWGSVTPGFRAIAGEALSAGDLVTLSAAGTVSRLDISTAKKGVGVANAAYANAATNCQFVPNGAEVAIADLVGANIDDVVYWNWNGATGSLSLTATTTSGERVWQVGVISDNSAAAMKMIVDIEFIALRA